MCWVSIDEFFEAMETPKKVGWSPMRQDRERQALEKPKTGVKEREEAIE